MSRFAQRSKMLRRQTAILLLSSLALFLTGCGRLGGYTEPEEISVVSAIGFDYCENRVRVSLQAVNGGENAPTVTCREGESVSAALSLLYGESTKRYELSHCALAVMGAGLSEKTMDEIFSFFENEKGMSDAVLWVAADDARDFLSSEGAVGYDVASSMRPYPEGAGLFSRNRFYEIKSDEILRGGESIMVLPCFEARSGGYSLSGLRLYRSRGESAHIDRRESALYLMMRGIFTSGQVIYTYEGVEKAIPVSDCRAVLDRMDDGELRIRLMTGADLTDGEKTALLESCRADAARLYERLGAAFFGYADAPESLEIYFDIEKES